MRRSMRLCAVLALGATMLAGGLVPAATATAAPGTPMAVQAATPPATVPDLDAPGPAKSVDFPPDGHYHGQDQATVQAPQFTRITAVNFRCVNVGCVVTIAPDGSSATVDFAGGHYWTAPWTVSVAAEDDAPLAGGQYDGSLTYEGVTVDWPVNITQGTPGAFGGYASNNPGGGAQVQFIDPAKNAAADGFMVGDVITSVDGQPVTSAASLNATLAGMRAGITVPVGITRTGSPTTLQYTIDQ